MIHETGKSQRAASPLLMLFFWSQLVLLRTFEPLQGVSQKKKARSRQKKRHSITKSIASATLECAASNTPLEVYDIGCHSRTDPPLYQDYSYATNTWNGAMRECRHSKSAYLKNTTTLSHSWKDSTSDTSTFPRSTISMRKPLEICSATTIRTNAISSGETNI